MAIENKYIYIDKKEDTNFPLDFTRGCRYGLRVLIEATSGWDPRMDNSEMNNEDPEAHSVAKKKSLLLKKILTTDLYNNIRDIHTLYASKYGSPPMFKLNSILTMRILHARTTFFPKDLLNSSIYPISAPINTIEPNIEGVTYCSVHHKKGTYLSRSTAFSSFIIKNSSKYTQDGDLNVYMNVITGEKNTEGCIYSFDIEFFVHMDISLPVKMSSSLDEPGLDYEQKNNIIITIESQPVYKDLDYIKWRISDIGNFLQDHIIRNCDSKTYMRYAQKNP